MVRAERRGAELRARGGLQAVQELEVSDRGPGSDAVLLLEALEQAALRAEQRAQGAAGRGLNKFLKLAIWRPTLRGR